MHRTAWGEKHGHGRRRSCLADRGLGPNGPVYSCEIGKRFVPVAEHLIRRTELNQDRDVLNLVTGTDSVALRVAPATALVGRVTAVDISAHVVELARQRSGRAARTDLSLEEGRAEALPVQAESIDVVLTCLSLMYVIDRAPAAREIALVLLPGAQLVAAVWAGP
jgi:ubiquinone/menaquinone biosynthesis C-methylase UbiE